MLKKNLLKKLNNENKALINYKIFIILSFLLIINILKLILINHNKNRIIESFDYDDFHKIKNIYIKVPFSKNF